MGRRRRTERNRNVWRPGKDIAGAAVAAVAVGILILLHSGTLPNSKPAAVSAKPRSQVKPGTTEDWAGTGLTATLVAPSKFATGACMEFDPAGGARQHETVFIDAGHGGIDPGGNGKTSSGATVVESQVNLSVALDAMKILTSAGYQVILDRTQQTTVLKLTAADEGSEGLSDSGVENDITARDECANLGKANLLIGIYQNAGAADEAGSVTVYDNARPFTADNQRFADLLQADVLAKLNAHGAGVPDGGVSNDDSGFGSTDDSTSASYGHLQLLGPAYPSGGFTTPSEMPGALIEPLFLSDTSEATIAASSQGQEEMAAGMAQAAEAYFAAKPAAASSASAGS